MHAVPEVLTRFLTITGCLMSAAESTTITGSEKSMLWTLW